MTPNSVRHSQTDPQTAATVKKRPGCDPAAAIARLAGHVDLYCQLVTGLLNDRASYLDALQRAVDESNSQAVQRAAHALKGLALNCGAEALARAAAQLETMGRSQNLDGALPALEAVQSALADTRQELGEYWRRDAGAAAS